MAISLSRRREQSAPAAPPLWEQYKEVRRQTEELCRPLATEDYVVQSSPEASPVKWHLAHTSWFFETFLLKRFIDSYQPFHRQYDFLFNSYYNSVGPRVPQPQRGLLSRPTVREVYRYRQRVDERMSEIFESAGNDPREDRQFLIELGINHEQQHQELILTDIKHAFSVNPLHPVYPALKSASLGSLQPMRWLECPEGLYQIGEEGSRWAFDNERPSHQQWIEAFDLAWRPVTNGEYMLFIEDGAYLRPELWLSAGWEAVRANGWRAPLYWEKHAGVWRNRALSGFHDLQLREPVCHVSYFEADAYARWSGARLPTEYEWEAVARRAAVEGNFLESGFFHPKAAGAGGPSHAPQQIFGDVWEWTQSAYSPYPGYKAESGALGEYNGKFMCGQMVLRGGSCATPRSHIRPSYRNFFAPQTRWQFSGIRLARDTR